MAKKAVLKIWHKFGQIMNVKRTITYREITVAIGILVAMVIGLTLWVSDPGDGVTGGQSQIGIGLRISAQTFLDYTRLIVK